jgi:hypothetical protein
VVIEVTDLAIGDSVHVRDLLDRYSDFDFNDDEATTIANVVPPKVEVEPAAEVEEEEAEEPELVAKEKEEKPEEAPGQDAAKED